MKTGNKPTQNNLKPIKMEATRLHPECVDESAIVENSLRNIIDKKSQVIEAQKVRIALLEEYLRLERARTFGRSSEKHPGQGCLFNEAETEACNETPENETTPSHDNEATKKKGNGGRKPLSPKIPREQVRLTLSDEEKEGAIDTFFTTVKEELDVIPAKVRVIEYLQEKAVFNITDNDGQNKRHIKSASLPKHPIPRSIGSIGLIAYIVVAKYCDGLPLYRLEKILQRYGGSITRTTMANWMIRLSLELQPLINLMREHQTSHNYIQRV